jgi:hypothetical protein
MATRNEVWERGIHLEWMDRGYTLGGDFDMSSELSDIEDAVAEVVGKRWKATLADDPDEIDPRTSAALAACAGISTEALEAAGEGGVLRLVEAGLSIMQCVQDWMKPGNPCPLCRHHYNHTTDCAYMQIGAALTPFKEATSG